MTRLSPQLEKYKDLVGEELLARIYQLADELAGVRVLHMNTTAQGGGVAELLRALLPIMDFCKDWGIIPETEALLLLR